MLTSGNGEKRQTSSGLEAESRRSPPPQAGRGIEGQREVLAVGDGGQGDQNAGDHAADVTAHQAGEQTGFQS